MKSLNGFTGTLAFIFLLVKSGRTSFRSLREPLKKQLEEQWKERIKTGWLWSWGFHPQHAFGTKKIKTEFSVW